MFQIKEKNALQELRSQYDKAYPQEILSYANDTYGDGLAVVTSFQITGIVTLHMLRQITDNVQVVTLDTGLLFPETYQLMEKLEEKLDIQIQRIKPDLTLPQQAREHGSLLWETNPDNCCQLRKTIPLTNILSNYDAWITGLRRDQSPTRANIPVIDWDERYNLVKLCPFANWTEDMLWTYINAHELPYNSLHSRGYSSIGCYTCTRPAAGREGRWSNTTKTECGIHYAQIEEKKHATA
ncbi:MAG: phosphoadenylyl-sulfate reductase [Phototrophicaceae bacterium]